MRIRYTEYKSYTQRQQQYKRKPVVYVGRVLLLLSILALLSACTSPFATPSRSGTVGGGLTPSADPTQMSGSPTPTPKPPAITLQVVGSCPSLNWDSLVGTHANVNKVQKVTCGSLQGNGSVDALINVRYYTADARLDVYVYNNLSAAPSQAFKLQGLLAGDAQISPTNTVITAEIAPNGLPSAAPDLFKEYQWNGTTFGQILFPGIYPDMTYYQALQDQAAVAAGRDTWKTSGFPVLNSLALRLCHWSQTTDKTITYDSRTGTYIVQVTNMEPGGGGFVAKLFRLNNATTNIFEVMQVTPLDGVTSLAIPSASATITNPQQVSGSTQANGSVVGHVVLFDSSHIAIGDSGAISSPTASGLVSFTINLSYQPDAHGVQDGALAFFSTTQNNIALTNQVVMIKVFISY